MVQKRTGYTKITSVSVSGEFLELTNKYNLSPTEVYRRGVAVTLAGMGVKPYDNPLNQERLENANIILEEIQKWREVKDRLIKIKKILEELNNA